MWIFTSNAFLSLVAHRERAGQVVVRARAEGDIERVFPKATVAHTPDADYAYRTTLPKGLVASTLATLALEVDYDNFKNSVDERDRHDAYLDVWGAMMRLQRQRQREKEREYFAGFAGFDEDAPPADEGAFGGFIDLSELSEAELERVGFTSYEGADFGDDEEDTDADDEAGTIDFPEEAL